MALKVKSSGILRQLAVNLKQAPKRIQQDAAKQIQRELAKAIDREFETKQDPYGKSWQPPKDGGETMQKSGRLRRGFVVEVVPGGVGLSVRITNEVEYAKWLQKGTERMEARRMIPDGTLPESWKRIFDDAYAAAIAKWYATTDARG
jgi:phage gpG-like protein